MDCVVGVVASVAAAVTADQLYLCVTTELSHTVTGTLRHDICYSYHAASLSPLPHSVCFSCELLLVLRDQTFVTGKYVL